MHAARVPPVWLVGLVLIDGLGLFHGVATGEAADPQSGQSCPVGQVVTGFNTDGSLICAPAAGQPMAVDTKNKKEFKSNRLFLGLGGLLVRFDSNVKFTDKASGLSVFIDAEGTLNLPASLHGWLTGNG